MEAAIDYSLWALFARAALAVKVIMVMLVLASAWCWAVVIDKGVQFRRARGEARAFDRAFWSGEPLDGLFERIGPQPAGRSQRIFASGMTEWRR